MEDTHKSIFSANFRKILGLQLKNSAAKGKLNIIKASYKLSDAGKKAAATKLRRKLLHLPLKNRRRLLLWELEEGGGGEEGGSEEACEKDGESGEGEAA
ncbi:hypothetical protein SASPL_146971 [Salvia splendens]|uniref:Histone H1/5 n=1 Tax=Salvia splendens TaxID=180675 RepID=A0A8X8WEX4_SALSN|nr:hypothetical protein SASPL_146971 [Salvia splendens]